MKMRKSYSEKIISLTLNKRDDDISKKHKSMKMRSISDKSLKKNKDEDDGKKEKSSVDRFLININIVGSAGPIRFVVNGDDNASIVIKSALKMYAREGRLPVLGADADSFLLYPANAGYDALKPTEAIASHGVRNFLLCKKHNKPHMTETRSQVIDRKGSGWRAWLQKSFKIRSY